MPKNPKPILPPSLNSARGADDYEEPRFQTLVERGRYGTEKTRRELADAADELARGWGLRDAGELPEVLKELERRKIELELRKAALAIDMTAHAISSGKAKKALTPRATGRAGRPTEVSNHKKIMMGVAYYRAMGLSEGEAFGKVADLIGRTDQWVRSIYKRNKLPRARLEKHRVLLKTLTKVEEVLRSIKHPQKQGQKE